MMLNFLSYCSMENYIHNLRESSGRTKVTQVKEYRWAPLRSSSSVSVGLRVVGDTGRVGWRLEVRVWSGVVVEEVDCTVVDVVAFFGGVVLVCFTRGAVVVICGGADV